MVHMTASTIAATILITALFQIQSISASPTHSWSETVCIDFEEHAVDLSVAQRCVKLPNINNENAAEMAAFAVGSLCTHSATQGNNAATVEMATACCQDQMCFARMHKHVSKRIQFGAKIVDPENELKKRLRRNEEDEHEDYNCGKTFAQRIDCMASKIRNAHATDSLYLLQVGAHVGALDHDPVFPHVFSDTRIRAVVIEPLPFQFAELTRNYAPAAVDDIVDDVAAGLNDFSVSSSQQLRIQLLNAAVCPSNMSDTLTEFVCSRPPVRQVTQSITDFKSRMFDYLYRGHHSQMGRLSTVMQASGSGTTANDFESSDWHEGSESHQPVTVEVRCVSAEYAATKLGRVDVLVIDAEGADFIVLESVLQWAVTQTAASAKITKSVKSYFPALVLFEHSGLSFEDKKNAIGLMDGLGYTCELHNMQDVMCVLATHGHFSNMATGGGNDILETPRSVSAGNDIPETSGLVHGGNRISKTSGSVYAGDSGSIGIGGNVGKNKKTKKKKSKYLTLMIDEEVKEVEFNMDWHADNSALLGCMQHVIQAHQCARLVQAVHSLHDE